MMKSMRSYVLLISLVLMVTALQAQTISSSLDSTNILVGDQVTYSVRVTIPRGASCMVPVFSDTLVEGVEILGISGPDTLTATDSLTEIQWDYLITAFDSAFFIIPPLSMPYRITGDTNEYLAYSEPHLLSVYTMPVDMEKGPFDIKKPYEFPLTWQEILRYSLLGLGILVLLFLVAWIAIRVRRGQSIIPTILRKALPAHETALRELEKLRREGLWQKGEVKEYYVRLSTIFRTYVEGQFGLAALESTSEEIMHSLRENDIAADLHDTLNEFFGLSDLVKFAKALPLPDEHASSFSTVESFVRLTMPSEEETQETGSTKKSAKKR